MRTDTGNYLKPIINGKHFKSVNVISIDVAGTGSFSVFPAYDIQYSSTIGTSAVFGLGESTSTTLSFTLSNVNASLLDSFASISALYGKDVKLESGFVISGINRTVQVFSGSIKSFTEQDSTMSVKVNCTDSGRIDAMQHRESSILYQNLRVDEWINLLAGYAGLSFTTHGYGLFSIPWLWLEEETVLEQMITAAESEGGLVYVDENSTVHYWSPTHWVLPAYDTSTVWSGSTPWSITENTDFVSAEFEWSEKEQYDDVIVNYQPRYIANLTEVYTLDRTVIIPAATRKELIVKYSQPVVDQHKVDYVITNSAGDDFSDQVTWNSLTEPDPIADLGLHGFAEHWKVAIVNNNTLEDAYLSKFTVSGRILEGATDVEQRSEDDLVHTRVYKLTGNTYIQTEDQAEYLSYILKSRVLNYPRMKAKLEGVKPNPLLQIGDTILVTSANAGLTATAFYVSGITYNSPSNNMNLDLIYAAGYFSSDNYFIIGTNRFDNATNTLEAVLFV